MLVEVETAFVHCSKAIVRSKLWDEATKIDRRNVPSLGAMITELSSGELDGEAFDRAAPERIKAGLY